MSLRYCNESLSTRTLFLLIFAGLLAAHLCHTRVLWAEEDLPLAAAQQVLFGKTLYRDVWFDKPPLVPLVYLLWGARIGVLLRIMGALYCLLVAWLAYATSRALWSEREGRWAGVLMAFFLTFDTPSAVLPLAADSLLIAPHLAAILLAIQGRPVWSGVAAGVGFFANAKALFVLASCAVFAGWSTPFAVAGFAGFCAVAAGLLTISGACPGYIDQVWIWSSAYARNTFVDKPVMNGVLRTANWSGFHLALLMPAGFALKERRKWQLIAWAALSLAGVALGWRFFPRYYFQLLPVAVVAASRGMTLLDRRWWMAALLLLIPAARFAPRYVILAAGADSQWADIAMDRESREASQIVNRLQKPGDTLYVWGFRPDLFPYTGLPAASRYIDCQAMTGVPADRHLTQSGSVLPAAQTAAARRELAASQPTFIVDGLSEYNPRLALARYPETHEWLSGYREIVRFGGIVIYHRR
jgi:hypothetical protein